VLFGEGSALLAGHGFNHLLLHLSGLDALVFHYQTLHNDNRAENHASEYGVFESDSGT
jgi:hypothetical protein